MNRDELVAALAGAEGAAGLCHDALVHGAQLTVLPGLVPTKELRTIYRRRAEHLRREGIAAIDADKAADQLDQTIYADLAVGRVEGGPDSHFFQLFFDPMRQQVITCLAVLARESES